MRPMSTERCYEVRVTGPVPTSVLHGLGDVEVATQELRTVLSGRFPDQAALYGFLNRLRSLGLDVVEVRQVTSRAAVLEDEGGTPASEAAPTAEDEPKGPR